MGVIRYMGETDFAKGEWCGVELDEPLGKNDGAVAGTRYTQHIVQPQIFPLKGTEDWPVLFFSPYVWV